MQLVSYLVLYDNVDVYDLHEAGFLECVISFTYVINEDAGDVHLLDYLQLYEIV